MILLISIRNPIWIVRVICLRETLSHSPLTRMIEGVICALKLSPRPDCITESNVRRLAIPTLGLPCLDLRSTVTEMGLSLLKSLQDLKTEFHPNVPLNLVQATGYAANAITQSRMKPEEHEELSTLAQQILDDPLALREFTERVYERISRDIKDLHERSGRYGRR